MPVEEIIDGLVLREGTQYTNRPDDSGGPTRYGITLDALRAWRKAHVTAEDVRNLTEDEARAIYRHEYITKPGFAGVLQRDEAIGTEVVDTGVNCGTSVAATFLQRSLNVLNRRGRDYPDIRVDGACGPKTLATLSLFLNCRGARGRTVMLRMLDALQGAHYVELAERREKDEAFVFGWFSHRVGAL